MWQHSMEMDDIELLPGVAHVILGALVIIRNPDQNIRPCSMIANNVSHQKNADRGIVLFHVIATNSTSTRDIQHWLATAYA